MPDTSLDSMTYLEPLVDIARTIGAERLYFDGDSRSDWEEFVEWAKEFQTLFESRLASGEEPGSDYVVDIEDFALRKAKEAGYLKQETVR